jgi:hypothetical protein
MDAHSRTFSPSKWPFAEPINAPAYTAKRVLHDGHPTLLVSHDHDGDWQMLCGTINEPSDGLIVCLGCIYEKDTGHRPWASLRFTLGMAGVA